MTTINLNPNRLESFSLESFIGDLTRTSVETSLQKHRSENQMNPTNEKTSRKFWNSVKTSVKNSAAKINNFVAGSYRKVSQFTQKTPRKVWNFIAKTSTKLNEITYKVCKEVKTKVQTTTMESLYLKWCDKSYDERLFVAKILAILPAILMFQVVVQTYSVLTLLFVLAAVYLLCWKLTAFFILLVTDIQYVLYGRFRKKTDCNDKTAELPVIDV
jgi:hypothetical protein